MLVVHYRGICVLLWISAPAIWPIQVIWSTCISCPGVNVSAVEMFPKKALFTCTVHPATSGLCFTVNSGQIRGTISEKFTLLKQGQCALYLIPNIQCSCSTLYPSALNDNFYSPLLAGLKSFVNSTHADRCGHTAAAAQGIVAHSSHWASSFLSKSADSSAREWKLRRGE